MWGILFKRTQREISRENLLNMLKHLNLIGEELQEEF